MDMTAVSPDLLHQARVGVAATLDTPRRTWLLGLARLAGVPTEQPIPEDACHAIVALCRQLATFPSGPVGYVERTAEVEVTDDYCSFSLSAPSAPHLLMRIGFGHGGSVTVGLTRSGVFEGGLIDPSGVLLTDMESVMADTYALSIATAVQLGYLGPIDFVFTVPGEGPGATPSFLSVDEDSGAIVCTACHDTPLPPLRHRHHLSVTSTAETIQRDLHALAERFARSVGAGQTQLVRDSAADLQVYDSDPLLAARLNKANPTQ